MLMLNRDLQVGRLWGPPIDRHGLRTRDHISLRDLCGAFLAASAAVRGLWTMLR